MLLVESPLDLVDTLEGGADVIDGGVDVVDGGSVDELEAVEVVTVIGGATEEEYEGLGVGKEVPLLEEEGSVILK